MERSARRKWKSGLALLLCALLLCAAGAPAWAEEAPGQEDSILDAEELTRLVEQLLKESGMPADRFSVGYCYTATGDEWYYNGDVWYYPASMYKVPMMMQLAEKESAGELTPESEIYGLPLRTVEEYILTYSNNDWAHNIRTYLGGDEVWREGGKEYAGLPDDYYDPDYMQYSYFTARYMTRVLRTLYSDGDARFPNVIDCLLQAQQAHYFRLSESMYAYPVAQKYGSFCDDWGRNFNHNAGIIYTGHPFILTVMTLNAPNYEKLISDTALLMTEYSLKLDEKLDAYEKEQAEKEAARLAAERKAAEEAEEQARLEAERRAAERAERERQRAEAEQREQLRRIAVPAGAALLLAALLALGVALNARRRKRKRYEGYRRRFEEELRREAAEREYAKRDN